MASKTTRNTRTKEVTPEDVALAASAQVLDIEKPDEGQAIEEPNEKKEPLPGTAVVAWSWIEKTLKSKGPLTKKELNELGLKSNPKLMNGKAIAEAKKIGEICPANKGGAYISEGLDPGRNGDHHVVEDPETKKLSLPK